MPPRPHDDSGADRSVRARATSGTATLRERESDQQGASHRREPDASPALGVAIGSWRQGRQRRLVVAAWTSLASMNRPDFGNRYGSPNVAMKIL